MKEIIILAMGGSRIDCPFDCEVWGLNNGYRQVARHNQDKLTGLEKIEELESRIPTDGDELFDINKEIEMYEHFINAPFAKMDKLFIFHKDQEWDAEDDPIFSWKEINGLIDKGLEVTTLFDVAQLPRAKRVYLDELIEYFGTEYFSDSIAYMIAIAIMEYTDKVDGVLKLKEPLRLKLYGVDMHTKDEFVTERGGIEYFVGAARAIGIDVWIHPESSVCITVTRKPYGVWEFNPVLHDPDNIMELQKTEEGLRAMRERSLIDEETLDRMLATLERGQTWGDRAGWSKAKYE